MHKQTPKLEWRFSESDTEWAQQQAQLLPEVAAADSRRLRLKQYVGSALMVLIFFTSVGGWWRYSTQAKVHAVEAELRAVVAQKSSAAVTPDADALVATINHERTNTDGKAQDGGWEDYGWEYSGLPAPSQPDAPTVPLEVAVQTMEVFGEQAIANVVMLDQHVAPVFRQTRFYQLTSSGWQLMPPTATLWGEERTLATLYFVYHFRQRDAAVVAAVAPQIDALYTRMWRNFGLSIDPMPEKLVIDVRMTQPPGRVTVFDAAQQISVASPAAYLAPIALTDVDLLAQSIALPLLAQVVVQARTHYTIDESRQPLLDSLYLWQMWDIALPLAAWREDVVKWLYVDFPASQPGQPVVLPARYAELCASHKLWLRSPLPTHIPLLCTEGKWENANLLLWSHSAPPIRLEQLFVYQLSIPTPDDWVRGLRGSHPGQAVALATLIEYAVATYGRDQLPVLVASLGQHQSWNTLLSAVYGVSAAEFEAGWQAYLAAHYGVAVAHERDAE